MQEVILIINNYRPISKTLEKPQLAADATQMNADAANAKACVLRIGVYQRLSAAHDSPIELREALADDARVRATGVAAASLASICRIRLPCDVEFWLISSSVCSRSHPILEPQADDLSSLGEKGFSECSPSRHGRWKRSPHRRANPPRRFDQIAQTPIRHRALPEFQDDTGSREMVFSFWTFSSTGISIRREISSLVGARPSLLSSSRVARRNLFMLSFIRTGVADGARLVCDRASDRLANPPSGVGRKSARGDIRTCRRRASGRCYLPELVSSEDASHGSRISGNGNHKSKICFDQVFLARSASPLTTCRITGRRMTQIG